MNQLLSSLKAQIAPLFDTELSKLGGIGVAAYGINSGNHWLTVVGGAFTLIMHGLDSVFNSPTAAKPKPSDEATTA